MGLGEALKQMKRTGPKTEPCGTPAVVGQKRMFAAKNTNTTFKGFFYWNHKRIIVKC